MMSLVDRFTNLADNAQAFMASLRRAIDFVDADVAAFFAYKELLISYLERFIADLASEGGPDCPPGWPGRAGVPVGSHQPSRASVAHQVPLCPSRHRCWTGCQLPGSSGLLNGTARAAS